MTMPKYHELFNDVLAGLSDGKVWRAKDFYEFLIDGQNLSEAERSESLSGGGNRAKSRAYFACEHLFQAGAVSRPSKGYLQITALGRQLLADNPDHISVETVRATDGFQAWIQRIGAKNSNKAAKLVVTAPGDLVESDATPEELIDAGVNQLRTAVSTDLLERIRIESPKFLEEVVLKVLHAMGYGEGEDDISHLGGPGDGGVDGVINQDKLGLDQIYVQAKRYQEDSSIGPDVIQSFVGAVHGKGATRGVFITTSRFTPAARKFAEGLPQPRIVLVDGDQLADLMLEHEIGVALDKVFKVYKIDENFFEE